MAGASLARSVALAQVLSSYLNEVLCLHEVLDACMKFRT